jgi:hypothetical protein
LSVVIIAGNVPRAGDRNPVLRLRQGYGAYTLLPDGKSGLATFKFWSKIKFSKGI